MSGKDDVKPKLNELLKKAVSIGSDVYFNAEDKVTKTLSAAQFSKDFLKDNILSLFDAYRVQIVSEVRLRHRDATEKEGVNVMSKKVISSSGAPAAIGPYSQAVEKGGMVFLSGQIPLDPKSMEVDGKTVEEQTERVFKNLSAVLKEADLKWDNVVKMQVYLQSMNDFAKVNEIYAKHLKDCESFPARACVEVSKLPKGVLVEIDAIAVR